MNAHRGCNKRGDETASVLSGSDGYRRGARTNCRAKFRYPSKTFRRIVRNPDMVQVRATILQNRNGIRRFLLFPCVSPKGVTPVACVHSYRSFRFAALKLISSLPSGNACICGRLRCSPFFMLIVNPQHLLPPPSGSSGVGNRWPLPAHLALEETYRGGRFFC